MFQPYQTFTGLCGTRKVAKVSSQHARSPSLMKIGGQISPTKMCLTTKSHILRQTARTEFFRWHFYFFLNHFFNFKFMQNALRDFQKKNTKFKLMKIDHFLGHFPARISRIWHIKIISWRSAWKNEENVHLRFFTFENSSQRYLQNMLRDFQNLWNYEK